MDNDKPADREILQNFSQVLMQSEIVLFLSLTLRGSRLIVELSVFYSHIYCIEDTGSVLFTLLRTVNLPASSKYCVTVALITSTANSGTTLASEACEYKKIKNKKMEQLVAAIKSKYILTNKCSLNNCV